MSGTRHLGNVRGHNTFSTSRRWWPCRAKMPLVQLHCEHVVSFCGDFLWMITFCNTVITVIVILCVSFTLSYLRSLSPLGHSKIMVCISEGNALYTSEGGAHNFLARSTSYMNAFWIFAANASHCDWLEISIGTTCPSMIAQQCNTDAKIVTLGNAGDRWRTHIQE